MCVIASCFHCQTVGLTRLNLVSVRCDHKIVLQEDMSFGGFVLQDDIFMGGHVLQKNLERTFPGGEHVLWEDMS